MPVVTGTLTVSLSSTREYLPVWLVKGLFFHLWECSCGVDLDVVNGRLFSFFKPRTVAFGKRNDDELPVLSECTFRRPPLSGEPAEGDALLL